MIHINEIEVEGVDYQWSTRLIADCEGHFFQTHIWNNGEVVYKKLTKGETINEKYIYNKILEL